MRVRSGRLCFQRRGRSAEPGNQRGQDSQPDDHQLTHPEDQQRPGHPLGETVGVQADSQFIDPKPGPGGNDISHD